MNSRQQQTDIVARMRDRLARHLAGERPDYDWRERRDDAGDVIARRERLDRDLERGDSPETHYGEAA